jgi:hypothetical protein
MKEPHPSLRLDNLVALQLDIEKARLELHDLRIEEQRLMKQLGKARKQVTYYEEFLENAARSMHGKQSRLGTLLSRLSE